MSWSPDQETALKRIDTWLKDGAPGGRFSLGGYAGTGKTTLAKHIAEAFAGEVKFAAFTGKAASVLRSKGCPNATTIHKLIYQPKGSIGEHEIEELQGLIQGEALKTDPDESKMRTWRLELERKTADSNAVFERKDECEIQEADLVIVDESSMVDRRMGNDLEHFDIPILYLGDPGQLPPVKGKSHLGQNDYDYVLTEIHRQAKDSPIIWLANEVREGRSVAFGSHGDGLVELIPKAEWDMQRVVDADQVLTGMNMSRHRITRNMRSFIGFNQVFPLAGDKLICQKNDHDLGVLNGVSCYAMREGTKKGNVIFLDVDYDGRPLKGKICDPGHFQEAYGERTHFPRGDGIQHFGYGYAVTVHKAQGSQWNHVVVADDRMRANDREQRARWLYTAFTRAEERLTYYA